MCYLFCFFKRQHFSIISLRLSSQTDVCLYESTDFHLIQYVETESKIFNKKLTLVICRDETVEFQTVSMTVTNLNYHNRVRLPRQIMVNRLLSSIMSPRHRRAYAECNVMNTRRLNAVTPLHRFFSFQMTVVEFFFFSYRSAEGTLNRCERRQHYNLRVIFIPPTNE